MTNEEITVKITEHDQRIKVCEHREADLEAQNESIHNLALSVHDLAGSVKDMAETQKSQGERIETIEKTPMKAWSRILWIVVTAVIGIAVGYLASFF